MIKYLIIDDEYLAHDIIRDYCQLLPDWELKKSCYDALEAFKYLNKHDDIDLIFLDLNMPKLKGFDFLRTLKNPPKVIVTTAYAEYALEGYELNISDYLLKPFGFERFLKAINKTLATSNSPISFAPQTATNGKRIFLRSNKKYTQVFVDEIQYIESAGNYVKVVTLEETILTRDKISDVLTLLPKEDFMQVHKSFAVATKHIKSIEGNRILIGTTTIPIGKIYKSNIIQLLK